MSKPKKNGRHSNPMELLKQRAPAYGPGCGCHAAGTPGKMRWMIGVIVLVAAGVLVVRAVTKSNGPSTLSSVATFADPVASNRVAGTSGSANDSGAAIQPTATSVLTAIGALSELDAAAAKPDAVFVYLPAKDGTSGNPPSAMMQGAARMVESKAGIKCGLFSLKAGTRDYDQIAAQMSVPGVLTIVKGRRMSAVVGEITEAKLMQGFVAASSAGACGPSAGSGCCPK